MQTIRLERGEWSFDYADRLGPPGGFGEVFRGTGSGGPAAIKRLKLAAGAASHREMSIGSALAERDHAHIVPVLDYGQDADGERYRSQTPLKIAGEVTDWMRQSPEDLQKFREKLASNKGAIIN